MLAEPMLADTPDAERDIARAIERLIAGDPAGAIADFMRARAGGAPLAARGLAVCLALCGRTTELIELVAAPDAAVLGRLAFLQTVLLELVGRKAWDAVAAIAAAFAGTPQLRAVAIYYVGCAKLAQRDFDGAWACFEEFKAIVVPRHRELPLTTSQDFNLIFRQACLIEPPASVAAIAANAPTPPVPAMMPVGEWRMGTTGPVFLCCCDSRYFQRFAAGLFRSLAAQRPDAVMHFHIAAPQDDDLALARALAREHPALALNLTLEQPPLFAQPVYYTCNRFLVVPALLRRYGRPVVTLDADSVLLDPLDTVIDAARGYDFACFETGRIEPASVFQATIMSFAASDGALRLLDLLGRLVLAKLSWPPVLSWMLDQAALYSAIRFVEKTAPAIAIGDLAALTGKTMRDFIGAVGTMDEKQALMNRQRTSS